MADYWYDKHLSWNQRLLGFKPPKRLPSEYICDHILLSVQHVPIRQGLATPEHVVFVQQLQARQETR